MNYLIKQRTASNNLCIVSNGVVTYVRKGDLIPFLSTSNENHWSRQQQESINS